MHAADEFAHFGEVKNAVLCYLTVKAAKAHYLFRVDTSREAKPS